MARDNRDGRVPITEACRLALRLGECSDYDAEIADLIAAARVRMTLGGVSAARAADDGDPLVRIAIIAYVKSAFGLDNPDAARYAEVYDGYVTQMKSTSEYGCGA